MNDTCNMCVHFVPTTCLVGRIRLDFKSSFQVHWEMVIRQRFCFLYTWWTWGLKSSSKLSNHIFSIRTIIKDIFASKLLAVYTAVFLTGSGNDLRPFSLKVIFSADIWFEWSLQRDYISVVNYSRAKLSNLNRPSWTQKFWLIPCTRPPSSSGLEHSGLKLVIFCCVSCYCLFEYI